MTTIDPSTAAFFEEKYLKAPRHDPWNFTGSHYELGRYAAIVEALQGQRYLRAFEPGCSIGVLTFRLARLCDALDASDFSLTAVQTAQSRCATLPNVTIRCEPLDAHVPWQQYDLVVLCEIGYYFEPAAWASLSDTMCKAMRPSATLLASHWLGNSKDHVQSGDEVHAALSRPELKCTLDRRLEGFRLQRWRRLP